MLAKILERNCTPSNSFVSFFSKRDITLLTRDWLRKNPLNQSEAMSRLGLTKQTKSHFLALFIPIFMFLKVLNPFFSHLEGSMVTHFH